MPLVSDCIDSGLDVAAEALEEQLGLAIKESGDAASLPRCAARRRARATGGAADPHVRCGFRGCRPVRPLSNFDYGFQPSIERSTIETLGTCAWIRERANVLFQGPPGVGKTHLAIALGNAGRGERFQRRLLPPGGAARGDAPRRGDRSFATASAQVHQRRSRHHRRGRLRADEPSGRQPALSGWSATGTAAAAS